MTVDADRSPNVLGVLGFAPEGEVVWQRLVAAPMTTFEQLVADCGLRSDRVEQEIAALTDAGLLRAASTPTGVRAVDPTLAVESMVAREERQMAQRAEGFAVLRTMLPALAAMYSQGRNEAGDLPGFEVVLDLPDIQRQISQAAERVKTDVRALDHNPGIAASAEMREMQFALLERGVQDRAILAASALKDPAIFEQFRDLQDRGHDARTLPDVSTRLFIYDEDLAVLPIDSRNVDLGAVFIRVPSLVQALAMMYDHVWASATPIFLSASNGAPVGRHARILELLALGHKDEAISRALKIGVRTIRRDVAELKRMLGVSTRTEIAASAVRHGWL